MVATRVSRHRFWPPGERDWRWWTYVGLGCLATVGLLGAAYLDWNAFAFPRPGTLVAGEALLAVGITGFLGATFDLGVEESSGMVGELRIGGYYRYARNPQLVFLLATVAGFVLAANSLAVLAVGAGMAVWFLTMSFAEEPWLRQQHGTEYETYRREVPRVRRVADAEASPWLVRMRNVVSHRRASRDIRTARFRNDQQTVNGPPCQLLLYRIESR